MIIQLLIISGRSGSGKSSTANEIAQQLKRRKLCHAHIDGDNLDAIFPEEPEAEMLLDNLAAMWSNYHHKRGITRLIISGTAIVMEFDKINKTISDVCRGGTANPANVDIQLKADAYILTIPSEVAVARLTQREVGSELAHCLESSNRMSGVLEETIGAWATRVPTQGRHVKDVAMDILKQAGWIE